MSVEIRELEPMTAACIRHISVYRKIGPVFGQLAEWAGRTGIAGSMLANFFDDPHKVPEDQLRSDAGVVVPGPVEVEPPVEIRQIEGGTYVVWTHVGHYEGLADAWFQFFVKHLPEAGITPRVGPCFEVYLDDPETTPWERVRTELYTAANAK